MIDELDKLIQFINLEYNIMSNEWKKSEKYNKINLKKKIVNDVYKENNIFQTILNYRIFLNEKNISIAMNIQKFNTSNCNISVRVKAQNSIEFKIKNYIDNHEHGKTPIIKCFNDLFGLRIIFNNPIEYNIIEKLVNEKYKKFKCIPSIRGEYIATHIYFMEDNYTFPWELQLWCKKNEKNNIKSHEKYKQDYTKWELKNKGGISNDNTLHIIK